MNYGLPYMGSKSQIAEWVVLQLPRAAHFYDLFAGGCAIIHAAMAMGRYQTYHANDITESAQLFAAAVRGDYRGERRWISRAEFFSLKDTDPYVRLCWSFGNSQHGYMYSQEIEPWKRAYWNAVVLGDFTMFDEMGIGFHGNRDDVRTFIRQHHEFCRKKYIEWWLKQYERAAKGLISPPTERLQRLQSLQSLQRLQRLQSLESTTAFDHLAITQGDYQAVEIKPDSVIYCDPPYRGGAGYLCDFDHERFYEWAERQTNIFVSEYSMPSEFKCIVERSHRSRLSPDAHNAVVERLFVPVRHKYFTYTQLSLFD